MFIKQWHPLESVWSEMNRVQQARGAAFERSRQAAEARATGATFPPLNMWADENNLYLEAELPGLERDDLEVYVDGNQQLTIKGQKKQPEVKEGSWYRRERAYGEFSRVIELADEVDKDKVEADLKNGVLTLVLPKMEETKPRRIQVNA